MNSTAPYLSSIAKQRRDFAIAHTCNDRVRVSFMPPAHMRDRRMSTVWEMPRIPSTPEASVTATPAVPVPTVVAATETLVPVSTFKEPPPSVNEDFIRMAMLSTDQKRAALALIQRIGTDPRLNNDARQHLFSVVTHYYKTYERLHARSILEIEQAEERSVQWMRQQTRPYLSGVTRRATTKPLVSQMDTPERRMEQPKVCTSTSLSRDEQLARAAAKKQERIARAAASAQASRSLSGVLENRSESKLRHREKQAAKAKKAEGKK